MNPNKSYFAPIFVCGTMGAGQSSQFLQVSQVSQVSQEQSELNAAGMSQPKVTED